jgi:hypothetical protein
VKNRKKKDYSELFKKETVPIRSEDMSPEEFSEKIKDWFENRKVGAILQRFKDEIKNILKNNGYPDDDKLCLKGEGIPEKINLLYDGLFRLELIEECLLKKNIESAVLNALWFCSISLRFNLISLRRLVGIGLDCEKGSLKSGDGKRDQVAIRYHSDWCEWQTFANEYWKRNPAASSACAAKHVLTELKKQEGLEKYPQVNTIRKRIVKPN